MKNIVQSMAVILANSYALTIKTQNYHWNVTGPNFRGLHLLFEEQYNELAPAIDILAERIRQLGGKVDASLEGFAKLSQIKEGSSNFDAGQMLEDLAKGNRTLSKLLKEGIDAAEKAEDPGTADMLTARLEAHEKNVWMLEASL